MNLSELRRLCERGERLDYLLFWGHTQKQAGKVDASCFSQWFIAPFTLKSQLYLTAEHYMMAAKARLFGDEARLQQILLAKSPAQAKKLGRLVSGFDEQVWCAHREDIVLQANRAKFTQHQEFAAFLLATKQKVIVEASPYDKIWGIGMSREHVHAEQPRNWRGLNLLGFALMQVRAELAQNAIASSQTQK